SARPRLRRVAEPEIGAALQAHRQVERPDTGRARVRQLDLERAAVDLLLAEELVAVDLASREHGRAERRAGRPGLEPELLAIEVVAVDDVEAHAEPIAVGRHLVRVRLLRTQDVGRSGAGRGSVGAGRGPKL